MRKYFTATLQSPSSSVASDDLAAGRQLSADSSHLPPSLQRLSGSWFQLCRTLASLQIRKEFILLTGDLDIDLSSSLFANAFLGVTVQELLRSDLGCGLGCQRTDTEAEGEDASNSEINSAEPEWWPGGINLLALLNVSTKLAGVLLSWHFAQMITYSHQLEKPMKFGFHLCSESELWKSLRLC
ncbi:hypothetical protein ZIOFF_050416 [Zingiber officinale]|uniref:Uncharacterized protein n=1 Tax=Zingiber officinale TaxID=94328 RepID=A0A8J5FPV9_ZINOF|nr:hypothetical protein ZIOFF_050416 [Zingiber officinale]